MKTHVIRLEPNDDLVSAGDRLAWCNMGRVLMVWPAQPRYLGSRLDIVLLQRQAAKQGAQLAFVVSDGEIYLISQELGIPVFSTALQAQSRVWRKPRRTMGASWRFPPSTRKKSTDLSPLLVDRWQSDHKKEVKKYFAGGLVGIAFLALVMFFLPSVRIRFPIQGITQNLVLDVWASPGITVPHVSGGMPAYKLSSVVEKNWRITSTGSVRWPLSTASGEVLLTNLTEAQVQVNAGTVLLTTGAPPTRFKTTRSVILPAGFGRSAAVDVEAVEGGEIGNVPAGKIRSVEGSIGGRISVTNPTQIHGGRDQTSPAPSREDETLLRGTLLEEIKKMALEEMERSLGGDATILSSTIRITSVLEENRHPKPGQPADWLELSIRAETDAYYVKKADIQRVCLLGLDAGLPYGYKALNQVEIIQKSPPVLIGEEARWMIWVSRNITPIWSDSVLRQTLKGQTVEQARITIRSAVPLKSEPEIQLFPEWWPRLPWYVSRIQLEEVREVQGGDE